MTQPRRTRPRTPLLALGLSLATLAGCQDQHLPTGPGAVPGPLFNLAASSTAGTLVAWGFDEYNQVSHTPAGSDFVAVAAGRVHNVALRSNGTLVSWGLDTNNEVTGTPVESNFVAVAAGSHYSLALRSDGTLASWGSNSFGQLTGTPAASDFVAVAAGGYHGLALRSDGTLASWGANVDGQVINTPVESGFVAVAAGDYHSVALRSNGTLVSWGYDALNLLNVTPVENDFDAVAAGGAHSLALRSNGTLVSWGWNGRNQVAGTPVESDFVAVAAGWHHSVAIRVVPPSCEGVEIRMTRTDEAGPVTAGKPAAWTVELEVRACEDVTDVSALGGAPAWLMTTASTGDGTIGQVTKNKNRQEWLWEIGAMTAGDVVTASLELKGRVGKKDECGSELPLTGEWSATATAGAGPVAYDEAEPLTIQVSCESG